MNLIDTLEAENLNPAANTALNIGDDVRVHVRIKDGDKVRIQIFEGIVIAAKGSGPRATVTVRKNSFGVGVERVFPIHSPSVDKIEVKVGHSVRRAKLYYLRERSGKSARLKDAQN